MNLLQTMIITDMERKTYVFKGSLCGGVSAGDVDLTDFIRDHIAIANMFVFSGGFDEDDDS